MTMISFVPLQRFNVNPTRTYDATTPPTLPDMERRTDSSLRYAENTYLIRGDGVYKLALDRGEQIGGSNPDISRHRLNYRRICSFVTKSSIGINADDNTVYRFRYRRRGTNGRPFAINAQRRPNYPYAYVQMVLNGNEFDNETLRNADFYRKTVNALVARGLYIYDDQVDEVIEYLFEADASAKTLVNPSINDGMPYVDFSGFTELEGIQTGTGNSAPNYGEDVSHTVNIPDRSLSIYTIGS